MVAAPGLKAAAGAVGARAADAADAVAPPHAETAAEAPAAGDEKPPAAPEAEDATPVEPPGLGLGATVAPAAAAATTSAASTAGVSGGASDDSTSATWPVLMTVVPEGADEEEIAEIFEVHGRVLAARLVILRSRRVAVIDFAEEYHAVAAVEHMHGYEVLGIKLSVRRFAKSELPALRPGTSASVLAAVLELSLDARALPAATTTVSATPALAAATKKRPRSPSPPASEEEAEGGGQRGSKAFRASQVKDAARRRVDLVEKWREASKPRREGAIARMPPVAKADFTTLFEEWLQARNLEDTLERVENQRGWFVYKYKRDPVVKAEETWEQAFHGTWWYSLWSVLDCGVFLESDDKALGHDFWEPGVYCSPMLATGRWYARPQNIFGDGAYHRVLFELRVDPARRKRERQRGGVQWVFPTAAVALHAIWVQVNSPPANGEERVREWEAELEMLPRDDVSHPTPTLTYRLGANGTVVWPDKMEGADLEDDEESEEFAVPEYLTACNPRPRKDGFAHTLATGEKAGATQRAERPVAVPGPKPTRRLLEPWLYADAPPPPPPDAWWLHQPFHPGFGGGGLPPHAHPAAEHAEQGMLWPSAALRPPRPTSRHDPAWEEEEEMSEAPKAIRPRGSVAALASR